MFRVEAIQLIPSHDTLGSLIAGGARRLQPRECADLLSMDAWRIRHLVH